MAKMAMLVIAFEDLKKPVETSYSGYCASHPPLALPENLESRRYREVWFPDTLFFLPFRHRYIYIYINRAPPFSFQNGGFMADQTIED